MARKPQNKLYTKVYIFYYDCQNKCVLRFVETLQQRSRCNVILNTYHSFGSAKANDRSFAPLSPLSVSQKEHNRPRLRLTLLSTFSFHTLIPMLTTELRLTGTDSCYKHLIIARNSRSTNIDLSGSKNVHRVICTA